MNRLDTPETIAALHRTNAIAKARQLALHSIIREARATSSLEALREAIERITEELHQHEQNAISK